MKRLLSLIAVLLSAASAFAAPPPNDDFANRTTLTGPLPIGTTGTAVESTFEPGEWGAPVVTSVWYRWTAPATQTVRVHVVAATIGIIQVFRDTGTLPAVLDTEVNNRNGFATGKIFATFYARAGVTYAIQVFGDQPFTLGLQPVDFVINEIDVFSQYDPFQNGYAVYYGSRQYVEIIGPPNTPLTGRRLAFYEGSDVYFILGLDGYTTDARGLLLLGSSQITGRAVSEWTGSGSVSTLRSGQHTVALFKVTGPAAIAGPHTALPPTVFVEDAFGLGAANTAANECQDALGAKRFAGNADFSELISLGHSREGVPSSDAGAQARTPGLYSRVGREMTVIPGSVAEGSGDAFSLTLSRLGAIHAPITVTMQNPAPDKLAVPPTVTIPAGQESITVPLPAINDTIPDGGRTLTLLANFPTAHDPPGAVSLTITDDDILPVPGGLLARDLFAYPDGPLTQRNGGYGFHSGWVWDTTNAGPQTTPADAALVNVAASSLDPASPAGDRRVLITPPALMHSVNLARALPGGTNEAGTVNYFSVLLNPATTPSQHLGLLFMALPVNGPQVFVGKPGAGSITQYVIETAGAGGLGQATSPLAPVVNGRTVRLVARVKHGATLAEPDEFALFCDPLPGAPEPAPLAVKSVNIDFILSLGLHGNGGGSFDDLRIGTTWDSVTRPVYAPPVVVNEVAVPGAGAAAARHPRNGGLTWDAFVELVNPRTAPFDLSGATLHRDALAAGAPDYTFPAGTILLPGAAVVVVVGGNVPEGHTSAFGGALVLRAPAGTDFGTTGDLWLRTAGGDLINAVRHNSTSATVSRTRYPDGEGDALDFVDHPSTPGGGNASPGLENDGTPFVSVAEVLTVHLSRGSVVEGAGWDAAQLTVTRSGSTIDALSVDLRSDNESAASAPDVVIPAGESSVTTPISVPFQFGGSGDLTVTFTALAAGYLNGSETLTVIDSDRRIFINEINAQSSGGGPDAGEFIELYDGGLGNKALHDFIVVLFDGDDPNDGACRVIDLQGRMTNSQGFLLIDSTSFPELTPGWITDSGGAVTIYKKRTGNGMGGGAASAPFYDYPPGTPPAVNEWLVDAIHHVTDDAPDLALVALFTPAGVQADEGPAPGPGIPNFSTARCPDARTPFDSGAFRRLMPTPGTWNLTYPGFSTWGTPRGVVSELADNDNDGLDNLMEYALGGIPLSLGGEDPSSTHLLPEPLDNPFGELRLLVRKGPEAGYDPRLEWLVEHSTDLIHWTTRDVVIVQEDCATLTAAYIGNTPRVQLRLKVTRLP